MIRKQLTMAIQLKDDITYKSICFNTWKELHMHLFENGLYPELQVFDNGDPVLHYRDKGTNYELSWSSSVPGSVLFEIVNRHASAQL